MPTYTYTQPSKSLADRLYTAEFDDALVDQVAWKNPRYEGCKIRSKEINKYTPIQTASNTETGIGYAKIVKLGPGIGNVGIGSTGLSSFTVGGYYAQSHTMGSTPITNSPGVFKIGNFIPNITWQGDTLNPTGLNPNIKNKTTALYISNTVIGGEEDPQFTTLKNHSYININQILLINTDTNEVQLLDKQAENYVAFHSFITNDLPTKSSFSISLIDESISHNLKGPNQYKVKMNKGFLLKTFEFKIDSSAEQLTDNSSIYLYKGGEKTVGFFQDGVVADNTPNNAVPDYESVETQSDRLRFRYGTIEMLNGAWGGYGHAFGKDRIGPSFASSSIIENKFTQQYYSGSYGKINEPVQPQGTLNKDILSTSGLGSASRFIGLNTLGFLTNNNNDPTLTNQEKTELHITFFEGSKDFSSGSNDERSIATFEVDRFQDQLNQGGVCNDFLPQTHELLLKGPKDDRFMPKTGTYEDNFIHNYLVQSSILGGCVTQGAGTPAAASSVLEVGVSADQITNAQVYIQGGLTSSTNEIGKVGYISYQAPTDFFGGANSNHGKSNLSSAGAPLSGSVSASDNIYSGSFSYQLSFLDKDHTLITNLNKDAELFDGIGVKGVVLIPENAKSVIKNNIKTYLERAGIIDSSPNQSVLIADDVS